MATDADYYKVKVKEPFLLYEVMFRPGQEYVVSARVYDSALPDSRNFKDLCASAVPKPDKSTLP